MTSWWRPIFNSLGRLPAAHDHRRIARSLFSVSLFLALTKIVAAGKEVAIANAYGTGPIIDAYVFLFNILSWPGAIVSSVVLTVLIPALLRERAQDDSAGSRFRREILGSITLAGIAAALFSLVLMLAFLQDGASLLPAQTSALAKQMLPILIFILPLGFVASFLAANLMANHRHTNSLLEGVPALFILLIVVLAPWQSVNQLAWATIVGMLAQLVLLSLCQPRGQRLPRFSLSWRAPEWRTLAGGFGIVLAGQVVASASGVIDQIMVAPLGAGANATLGYATRVISLLMALGATAVARALLPVLSEIDARDPARSARVASRWTGALFLAGSVMAILAYFLAPLAIRILFERGAFTAQDTEAVAAIFRFGLLQLPFYFAGIVLVQLIASRGAYRIFLYSGVINFATKIAGNLVLIPIFGVGGALAATSLMYAISFPVLWVLSRR